MKQKITQDFAIEDTDYSLRAFGGRFTLMYVDGRQQETFLKFLYRFMGVNPGELEGLLDLMRKQGVQTEQIASWCISDLKNGYQINNDMRQLMVYTMNDPRGVNYEPRYGLSKNVFKHAVKFMRNLKIDDLKEAMRDELILGLSNTHATGEFEKILRFGRFSDNSPVLRQVLLLDMEINDR